MKLTVLVDNNTITGQGCQGEPALCFYLETGEERILFDTGYSELFLRNAEELGIDLGGITRIILSHGHDDHTGGLDLLLRTYDLEGVRLTAHPAATQRKILDEEDIGMTVPENTLRDRLQLELSEKPVWITENLLYLGEIPRRNDFENQEPLGRCWDGRSWERDFLYDDTALAVCRNEGIFIITGCSHSGICNIIEYAKEVTGKDRVIGVIGGFHLLREDRQLLETVRYLNDLHADILYPCHCVRLYAKILLSRSNTIGEVGAGTVLEI